MIQHNHIAPDAERAKGLRTHVSDGPVDLPPGRLQARLRECTRTQSDQYGRLEPRSASSGSREVSKARARSGPISRSSGRALTRSRTLGAIASSARSRTTAWLGIV